MKGSCEKLILLETVLYFLLTVVVVLGQRELDEPGICLKTEKYFSTTYVHENVRVPKHETYWCGNIKKAFRCSKTTYEWKTQVVPKTIERTRTIKVCCDGYEKSFYRSSLYCPPVCVEGCGKGVCSAPDKCSCYPGYDGPTCEEECPEGLWGKNCAEKCECPNGMVCHHVFGTCSCGPERTGDRCEIEEVTSTTEVTITTTATTDVFTTESQTEESVYDTKTTSTESAETFAGDTTPTETETTFMTETTPTEAVETTPTEAVETTPTEAVETTPTESIETTPTEAIETTPTESIETTPTEAIETTPTEAVETTPTESIETTFMTETTLTEAVETTPGTFVTETTTAAADTTEQSLPVEERISGKKSMNNNFGIYRRTDGVKSEEVNSNNLPEEPKVSVTTDKVSETETGREEENPDSTNELGSEEANRKTKKSRLIYFVPSLTVLSGVSILIFLMATRWLIVWHRKKVRKMAVEMEEKIFHPDGLRKCRIESIFLVSDIGENPVYLSGTYLNEKTPVLQTFKPLTTNSDLPSKESDEGKFKPNTFGC